LAQKLLHVSYDDRRFRCFLESAMSNKMTRRVVLGSILVALAVNPFSVRSWLRRRQIELPPDSFLAGLRTQFMPFLEFPRKFDIEYDDWSFRTLTSGGAEANKKNHRETLERFYALPKETRSTILETQRRYWHNFALIDEIEFDCTHFFYNEDGTKRTTNACFEGHVRLKYGYGLLIDGKDAEGKPILWIFNLDGEISAIASTWNISSMMLDFFGAYNAKPSEVLSLDRVYSTNAELPDNPYMKSIGEDRYTILSFDRYLQLIELPPHIEGKIFYKRYYNNRTGMLDYLHYRTFDPDSEKRGVIEWRRGEDNRVVRGDGDRYLNPKYTDPSVPLPKWGGGTEYWRNTEIEKGIFLPTEYASFHSPSGSHADDILSQKSTYSNIRIKRVAKAGG